MPLQVAEGKSSSKDQVGADFKWATARSCGRAFERMGLRLNKATVNETTTVGD
jgi:hypothetical protein